MNQTNFRQTGQSMIEVVIALMVTTVVLGALVITVLSSMKNAQFAQNQSKATKYAQEAIDQIKAIRDRNVDILVVNSVPPPALISLPFKEFLTDESRCGGSSPCFFQFSNGLTLEELAQPDSDNNKKLVPDEDFRREIKVSISGTDEKNISVKIFWTDSSGEHESFLETVLTSYR